MSPRAAHLWTPSLEPGLLSGPAACDLLLPGFSPPSLPSAISRSLLPQPPLLSLLLRSSAGLIPGWQPDPPSAHNTPFHSLQAGRTDPSEPCQWSGLPEARRWGRGKTGPAPPNHHPRRPPPLSHPDPGRPCWVCLSTCPRAGAAAGLGAVSPSSREIRSRKPHVWAPARTRGLCVFPPAALRSTFHS